MLAEPASDVDLLWMCATLRHFDHDLLRALVGVDDRHIAKLIDSDQIAQLPDLSGWYELRSDVRSAVLAHIRSERPTEEVLLHTRAFQHYLSKLQHANSAFWTAADEDDCLYHLDVLFILVGAQTEWQTLLAYIAAVNAVAPQQVRHLQRLLAYEGYIAIRIQDYDRGESILTKLLNQEITDADVRVKALKGLADAAFHRSHYDRALYLYQQLYAAASAAGDHAYQGLALLDTGLVYHSLDQHDRALDYCNRSLSLFHGDQDHRREGFALYHAGLYSMYLGRWEDARRYNAQAAQLFESLRLDSNLGLIYWQQGYLHHIFGDEAASEAAYARALPLAESPHHGRPLLAMDTWLFLGFLYHTLGRWHEALEHYERGLALANRLDRQHEISLTHFRRAQALQRLGRIDDAFAAYTQAIDGIEALGGATEGEDIKISLFGTTQQIYEAMLLLCLDLGRPADAFHYVERARSRAFLDTLVKKSPELYDALAQPVVTLADVQAQLPEGVLLLEYFTTGVLPSGEHMLNSIPESNTRLRQHLTLPPQVILFAITRDRCEVHRPALNPNSLRPPVGDRQFAQVEYFT